MMAPAHSLTGAAAGLGIASLLDASWQLKLVVVAVCCGAALLPDLDHPGATASRSLWWVTGMLSKLVAGVARAVYRHSRGPRDKPMCGFRHHCVRRPEMVWWRRVLRVLRITKEDRKPRRCGTAHRKLTHTVPGCVALGVVVGAVTACGHWPATVILGLLAALGAAGAPVIGATFTAVTITVAAQIPDLADHWLLWGVVVTLGCVVHVAGDAITTAGVPVLWPLLRDGRRWGRVRLPVLNFDAGSWPERLLITPALIVGCGWLGLVVFT